MAQPRSLLKTNRTLRFYYPMPKFPSVSITSTNCELNCSHCKGHYLQHMFDVSTPKKLIDFGLNHDANGGVGLLVSGGSTLNGKVPLKPFLGALRWIKDNTELILNLHTGVLSKEDAVEIAATGVDITSIDLVGNKKTLKQVYGLDVSLEKYMDTIFHLKDAGVLMVTPHICVGLHYGKVLGEHNALIIARNIDPEVIVFTSLIPTMNTPFEYIKPPGTIVITKLIKEARRLLPNTDISLGCMRSREDKVNLEIKAIQAGANRIALASKCTENWSLEKGYIVKKMDGCCAIPRSKEAKALRN